MVAEDIQNKRWYTDVHLLFTLILIAIFILSLYPPSGIILENNILILLSFVVILVLSYRFTEIQIPGFLKMSQAVEAVKKETQELRTALLQVAITTQATSKASASVNIQTLGNEAKELSEKLTDETGREARVEIADETPKTDIQRIREYYQHQDYVATFSVLRHLLEDELTTLIRSRDIRIPRTGLKALSDAALQEELISFDLYNGLDIVRQMANQFIHPRVEGDYIPLEKLNYVLELGITLSNEVRRLNA